MENENQNQETETKENDINSLERAEEVANRLEEANKKREELLQKEERLQKISGQSEAGYIEKPKEDPMKDPVNYSKAVFNGQVNPFK